MIMKKYILIPLFILVFSFLNLNYINSREEPGSAYDFSFKDIDGKHFSLSQFKGKPLLIFNSASKCGFTSQYTGLQKIHENYKDKGLVVIGVPSDNFNQEPGSEKEIKKYSKRKLRFSLYKLGVVCSSKSKSIFLDLILFIFNIKIKNDVTGSNAHPLFKWLNDNYDARPKWNFYKFVINKDGKLENHFSSMTTPSSEQLTSVLDKILK